MANLPPKPESPVKEERRHDPREARPMLSTHYRPEQRQFDNDRTYVPRPRPEADTYIASYESRRPPPLRDWERDRPRDRDFDRRRDSRRDWRDPDRRDTRPYDRWRDDDRFRPRHYEPSYRRSPRSPRRSSKSPPPRRLSRSRSPNRRRSRSPLAPRRYSRSRSPRRSRTRSPRRRPYSPARTRTQPASRSRSPNPRSPPSKRLKLGNHSISDSPRPHRARSRSHGHSRSRTRSRSPRRVSDSVNETPPPSTLGSNLPPASPIIASRPLPPKQTGVTPASHPIAIHPVSDSATAVIAPKVTEISATKTECPILLTSTTPSLQDHTLPPTSDLPITTENPASVKTDMAKDEHLQPRIENIRGNPSSTPKPDTRTESRGRSPSPPKGPRGSLWRRSSKSPPKGPRNHGASTPSMTHTPISAPVPVPASGPMYPTGPRADRRPKDPNVDLPVLRSLEFVKITPPSGEKWAKASQQPGPKGRYGVTQLEVDLVRYRSSRVHTNQDYDQISRNSRRALHELDMATIDLRMAESRRRIADAQLEKAKHGMLGIDAATDSTTDLV